MLWTIELVQAKRIAEVGEVLPQAILFTNITTEETRESYFASVCPALMLIYTIVPIKKAIAAITNNSIISLDS